MTHRNPVVRAAGGVLWRIEDGAVQVALVHRPRYDDWSLPKGKLEPKEGELAAAVREVGEETGSQVAVSRRLRGTRYKVDDVSKTVSFWTMRHVGGEFVANDEVDELRWLAPAAASPAISHQGERDVLDDFCATPLPDSVVVLVRHAKAGKRSEWRGEDRLRPLDRAGRAQATRLDGFLGRFAPDRILTARPVRCGQTVAPLAERLGLDVTTDAAFDDHFFVENPEISQTALLALATPRHVTVVASQGGAIPGLIERVAPHVRSSDTRKGAVWTLSYADGDLLAADYYPNAAR